MRKLARSVLSGILTAVLILIILANVYILVVRNVKGIQNATIFGFTSAVVLTGSMHGTIEPNDMIITKSQKSYQVGDIVMYDGGSSTVTHRIIEVTKEGYLTKGDANNTDDQIPIPEEKVIGKVVCIIPKIGSVISFFSTPLGMLILVLILFLMIEVPMWRKRK